MLETETKTRQQLIAELIAAQGRVSELEAAGEAHFAYLIHGAEIAHFLFSPDGELASANIAGLQIPGATQFARAIRKSLFESAHWTPELRGRLADGEVLRLRVTLDRPDSGAGAPDPSPEASDVIHLECTVSSLGEQGYAVQAHDVTEQVQSKAALRDRELFFRSTFQAIPYPTLVWKHAGRDRFTLYFYNASAADYSRGQLKALEGADLDEFYSHAPEFPRRIRQSCRTGQPISVEQPYTLRSTGEERFIRFTSAGVGRDYVLDSLTDLTELRQTQEALVTARQALERSLAEKELLLHEIHHRVKNNLSLLNSLLDLQAAVLENDRLRAILRDTQNRILSVARVHEALYSASDVTQIDLALYIGRLGSELREALAGPGIEMEYDLDRYCVSQEGAIYYGLLVNELISNAFKHAFPASLDRAGRVKVSLHVRDDCIELIVKDDGIGLPPGFSPEQSSSLGVHVVAMLVEQMDGSVTYESQPGRGTVVRVQIAD